MADKFNGSTITWNPDVSGCAAAALGVLEGLDDEHSAPEARITGADGSEHQFAVGREEVGLTVSLIGVPFDYSDDTTRPAAAHTGAIDATWADGEGPDPDQASAGLFEISIQGEASGPINSSMTFLPAPA